MGYTQPQVHWDPDKERPERPGPNVVYLIKHEFMNRKARRKLKGRPGNFGNGWLRRKESHGEAA